MKKIALIFSFLGVLGCVTQKEKSENVFFAGQIVNPTDNAVVLYSGDKVIDSTLLDKNNRFSFQLSNIKDGLYHFEHGNGLKKELQYVYFEKGDSIQIRLNTLDFDESLVFSGNESGAELNNFLIDMFLSHEEEEQMIYRQVYSYEPNQFSRFIDSLRSLKISSLNALLSEVEISKTAQNIAQASIDYSYFNYKEEYPFQHKRHLGQNVIKNLPVDFYDYRKEIGYSNSHLNYLRPYHDFMKAHIKNLSFANCSFDCDSVGRTTRNHLHVNRHKLSLIDSLVEEAELKDNLFRNVAINYLLMANDSEENIETFIDDFRFRSENNRHREEIENLYERIKKIQPQQEVPNIKVANIDGKNISLRDISKDKKVVFYFWSAADKKHFKNIVKQARHLSNTKKDYIFVGINIRTDQATWKGMVATAGLNKELQYKANDFDEIMKSLAISHLNKCVITENATILNAFSDLYATSL